MVETGLLIQTVVNGLLLGGIYVTVGVGFSLAFGVLEVVDFAVGEYVMLGAIIGGLVAPMLGSEGVFVIPLVLVAFFVVGFLVQPLIHHVTTGDRPQPLLMGLVFTFGLATFFRGSVLTLLGPNNRDVPSSLLQGSLTVPGVGIFPYVRAATAVFGVVALVVFMYYLYNTKGGMAIRAIAEDRTNARLMGIKINRYQSIAYGSYAALTAAAGVFIGMVFTANPGMGLQYTAFAFFMVVLAGMGYLPGVILSGIVLGLAQSLTAVYASSQVVLLVLFALIYAVLLVSPAGILGKGEWAS
ncbi:branched-chain amino acid ABC transporter permease [Salinigranum halophilum]|jgi:branched-chain amino acid transport system permease protein|uniref:branched-chain amino acid ABC transporter permease n=1 Tax=Salinigranum halophilum TaxID=2565931 RepID=UPI0010A91FD7|nr:branched-chain amino acid ABC transporter permease [Salinigranum halophilum]